MATVRRRQVLSAGALVGGAAALGSIATRAEGTTSGEAFRRPGRSVAEETKSLGQLYADARRE